MKHLVQRALRGLGWEVKRFRPNSSKWAQLQRMLSTHEINLVIDVGANTGQYARALRQCGFKGRIVSFEPLPQAYSRLAHNARHDHLWTVFPPTAIGDVEGVIDINISGNTVSSSVLPILQTHVKTAPKSAYVATESVPITRLDSVWPGLCHPGDKGFLKIDVQGFEMEVLKGTSSVISQIRGLEIELSLVPLYARQELYDRMVEYIGKLGFELWSLSPELADNESGRLLQLDGVFFRP